ncbi:MAG: hypothetical protein OEZ23_00570, partial [Gammaproteobacteria bacterium]|nr:hypothetical protein [Gammaproteobacteria bacterium]
MPDKFSDGLREKEYASKKGRVDGAILKTYIEFKKLNLAGGGVDKFFHCLAGCRAVKASGGDVDMARSRMQDKE